MKIRMKNSLALERHITWWTAGKVYDVNENGTITDDDGDTRPNLKAEDYVRIGFADWV